MNDLNRAEFAAAREGPEALEAFLMPFATQARTNPDAVIEEIAASVPKADQAVMARPALRAILAEGLAESVRQGVRGWADDDLAFVKPWGFELTHVKQEVRLWQGELDVLVPRAHAEYLESKLPHARLRPRPKRGPHACRRDTRCSPLAPRLAPAVPRAQLIACDSRTPAPHCGDPVLARSSCRRGVAGLVVAEEPKDARRYAGNFALWLVHARATRLSALLIHWPERQLASCLGRVASSPGSPSS